MAKRSASDIRFTMDHCYLYNPLVFLLLISLFQAEELLAFAPSPSFRTKLNGGGGGGGGGGAGNRNTRHDDPYQPHGYQQRQLQQLKLQELSEETEKVFETESTTTTMKKQTISLWKPPGRWWEPRIHINDVQVGQNLTGVIFQEFLNGTTGPKVFIDCGLGRIDSKGEWQIVTGMLRIGGRGMKESIIRKKMTKLRKKQQEDPGGISVFVSKVYLASSRIEVVTDSSSLLSSLSNVEPTKSMVVSVGSLRKDQELIGTVRRLEPYGALIDVGANRLGLLHIQKVADLYGRYIDKTKGIEEAGLEVGARIRVQVAEIHQKRLFLDFTTDVKQEAAQEQKQQQIEMQRQKEARIKALAEREAELENQKVARMQALADRESGKVSQSAVENSEMDDPPSFQLSDEEAAAWAAYAGGDETAPSGADEDDDDEYYDDDEEDEDRAIEDALGIGGW